MRKDLPFRRSVIGAFMCMWAVLASFGQGLPTRDAAFVAQDVPTEMIAGESYQVTVRMRNTGNQPWRRDDAYRLGSTSGTDPWGVGRALLGAGDWIALQGEKTFTFQVTAPQQPGVYTFEWRMLQEGVAWFGEKTPAQSITVEASPNWMPDPGFEKGTLEPFSAGLSNGNLSLETDSEHVYSGLYSLRHEATAADSYTTPWKGSNPKAYGGTEQAIRLSARVKASQPQTNVQLYLFSLDEQMNADAGYWQNETFSVGTDWQEVAITYICPPGRTFASLRLDNDGGPGSIVWWDDMKMVPIPNGIDNASFEGTSLPAAIASATNGNLTIDDQQAFKGLNSLKHTATATGSTTMRQVYSDAGLLAIEPGDTVTFTGYGLGEVSADVTIRLLFLDNTKTLLDTASSSPTLSTTWSKFQAEGIAPENAAYAAVELVHQGNANTSVWWDELLLTKAPPLNVIAPSAARIAASQTYDLGKVTNPAEGRVDFELPEGAENLRILESEGPVSANLSLGSIATQYSTEIAQNLDGGEMKSVLSLSLESSTTTSTPDRSRAYRNASVHGPAVDDGRYGWGLSFDGIDDFLTIDHDQSLAFSDAASLAIWVKPTTLQSTHLLSKKDSFVLSLDKGKPSIEWTTQNGTVQLVGQDTLPLDFWTYLVATYDATSGSVQLFVDGQLAATTVHGGTLTSSYQPLLVGIDEAMSAPFEGVIDEIDLFDEVLSTTEIDDLMEGYREFRLLLGYDLDGLTYTYQMEGQQKAAEVSFWTLRIATPNNTTYELPNPGGQEYTFTVTISNHDRDIGLSIPTSGITTVDFGPPAIFTTTSISCPPTGNCTVIPSGSKTFTLKVHVGFDAPDGEYIFSSQLTVQPTNGNFHTEFLDLLFRIGLFCETNDPCPGKHLKIFGPHGQISDGGVVEVDIGQGSIQEIGFYATSVGTAAVTLGPVSLEGNEPRYSIAGQPTSPLMSPGDSTEFFINFDGTNVDPNASYNIDVTIPTDEAQLLPAMHFTIKALDRPEPEPFFEGEYTYYGNAQNLEPLTFSDQTIDIGNMAYREDGSTFPVDPAYGHPIDEETQQDPRVHRRFVFRLHGTGQKVHLRHFRASFVQGHSALEWNFREDVLDPDPPTGSEEQTMAENGYFHFDGILSRTDLSYIGPFRLRITFEARENYSLAEWYPYTFFLEGEIDSSGTGNPTGEGVLQLKAKVNGKRYTLTANDQLPINQRTSEFLLEASNVGNGPLLIDDLQLNISGPVGAGGASAFIPRDNTLVTDSNVAGGAGAGSIRFDFQPAATADPTTNSMDIAFVLDPQLTPNQTQFPLRLNGTAEPFHLEQGGTIMMPGDTVAYGTTQAGANITRQYTLFYDAPSDLQVGGLWVPPGYTIVQNLPTLIDGGTANAISFSIALRGDQPAGTYSGEVRFNYSGGGDTGTYRFDVAGTVSQGPNQAPNAVNDSRTIAAGTTVDIYVLANDSDPDGDPISLGTSPIVNAPGHGTAYRLSANQIRYTPTSGYVGTDSFIYRMQDDHGATDTAVVTITVEEAAPGAPTNLTASDGTYNDVVLTWTPPEEVEHYKIYRGTSNNFPSASIIVNSETDPDDFVVGGYTDYTAPGGVTYYYWVVASNGGGDSPPSNSDSGYAAINPQPDLVISSASTQYTLYYPNDNVKWTIHVSNLEDDELPSDSMWVHLYESSDDQLDAGDQQFGLYLITPPYNQHPKVVNANSYLPETLPSGERYILFQIDAGGNVAETNEANNITAVPYTSPAITPPPVVPNFVGRIDGTSIDGMEIYITNPTIDFSWSTPADPSGIDRYQIVIHAIGEPWIYQPHIFAPASATSIATSNLELDKTYIARIRAKSNAGLWGAFIDCGSFTVKQAPPN